MTESVNGSQCRIRIDAAYYGRRQVLFNADVILEPKKVVGLFGHNGAGKSSLVNAAFGISPPIWEGSVCIEGRTMSKNSPEERVRSGMVLVPQGRGVFPSLTVSENFLLAHGAIKSGSSMDRKRLETIFELMPILRDKWNDKAGSLSGGQQQFVSVGRALLQNPRYLILDEPSVGLAPKLVEDMMKLIQVVSTQDGVGVLLVEQNVSQALQVIERAYVMRSGQITGEYTQEQLRESEYLWHLA